MAKEGTGFSAFGIMAAIAAVAIILAGCAPAQVAGPGEAMMQESGDDAMVQEDFEGEDTATDGEGDATMEQGTGQTAGRFMASGNVIAGTTTPYVEFNQEDYEKAQAEGKAVLLYFYANWCPVCKAEAPEVEGAFGELELDNVVGFRVNYKDSDTDADETALAKEFGITYQHTKVILEERKVSLKSLESWNRARYVQELTALEAMQADKGVGDG